MRNASTNPDLRSAVTLLALAFSVCPSELTAQAVPQAAAIELFSDEAMQRFTKRGGSGTFAFEDQTLVGRSAKYPNAFLCTKQQWGDFEFEVEFCVDDGLNSGIQIRSQAKNNKTVFGYQVEIDSVTAIVERWHLRRIAPRLAA